jgi:hypothetical protein
LHRQPVPAWIRELLLEELQARLPRGTFQLLAEVEVKVRPAIPAAVAQERSPEKVETDPWLTKAEQEWVRRRTAVRDR